MPYSTQADLASKKQFEAQTQKFCIRQFEKIIWQIDSLVNYQISLAELINPLELYLELYQKNLSLFSQSTVREQKQLSLTQTDHLQEKKQHTNPTVETTQKQEKYEHLLGQINRLLSSYDFLLLSLQPFWRDGEYLYRPESNVKNQQILLHFQSFLEEMEQLRKTQLPSANFFSRFLKQKIEVFLNQIRNLELSAWRHYHFSQTKNHLVISGVRDSFDLRQHFDALLSAYQPTIFSYLNFEDLQFLLDLLDLSDLFEAKQIEVFTKEESNWQVLTEIDLEDFLVTKINQARKQSTIIVVTTDQNADFKELQTLATTVLDSKNILLLGESGGVTKIASKLSATDFAGLLILKTRELDLLLKLKQNWKLQEIWLLGKLGWQVHAWWQTYLRRKNLKEEYLEDLYDLSLISYLNSLEEYSTGQVGLIESYQKRL